MLFIDTSKVMSNKLYILIIVFCLSCNVLANKLVSDNEALIITFDNPVDGIGLHNISNIGFTITTIDNNPVAGLGFTVEGGMLGHGHGLPTAPFITEQGSGIYTLNGMKYSMRGQWLLILKVVSGEYTDDQFTLALNVSL